MMVLFEVACERDALIYPRLLRIIDIQITTQEFSSGLRVLLFFVYNVSDVSYWKPFPTDLRRSRDGHDYLSSFLIESQSDHVVIQPSDNYFVNTSCSDCQTRFRARYCDI